MTTALNKNNRYTRSLALALALPLFAVGHGCDSSIERDDDSSFEQQYTQRSSQAITDFEKVFIVGDSLSDTHRMGNGPIAWCPNSVRGYWNYRFSNGYLWIDYLEQDNPGLAAKVSNYAVGGSGILKRYGEGLIGRTHKQALDLVSQNPDAVRDSLVIVWAGSNDIKENKKQGDPLVTAGEMFTKLRIDTIEYLKCKGVKDFILVGLPRIDLVPIGSASNTKWTDDDREWAKNAVNAYNGLLKEYAQQHDYVYLDVAEKIGEILNGNVTSVNMTDLSTPCWDGANCAAQGDTPFGSYEDKRCEDKMFFDRVHPTTGAHCGIAKWMEQAISSKYAIAGGDEDLESCASRRQTEAARWGRTPLGSKYESSPRPIMYKVQTALNPTDDTCVGACAGAGGTSRSGEHGNITLPNNTEVGYCTCDG